MLELIAGAAVAIAALALVLEPLARGRVTFAAPLDDEELFTPLEESDSPKERALIALKEIEFDHETGKLSDEDFDRFRAEYASTALAAIRAEDARAIAHPSVAATAVEDEAEALIRAARARVRSCPSCGPRPEADAAFCSACGRPLTPA